MFYCQIRSDKDKDAKVEYYLSGPGADKPPFNLFVVDHDTGFVRITNILDREKYPFFNVSCFINLLEKWFLNSVLRPCLFYIHLPGYLQSFRSWNIIGNQQWVGAGGPKNWVWEPLSFCITSLVCEGPDTLYCMHFCLLIKHLCLQGLHMCQKSKADVSCTEGMHCSFVLLFSIKPLVVYH